MSTWTGLLSPSNASRKQSPWPMRYMRTTAPPGGGTSSFADTGVSAGLFAFDAFFFFDGTGTFRFAGDFLAFVFGVTFAFALRAMSASVPMQHCERLA